MEGLGLSIADMLDAAASRVEGAIGSPLHAPIREDALIKAGIALASGLVLCLSVRGR